MFCSVPRVSSASRCWSSWVTRSVSAATILRSAAVASLPALPPAATTTSPVGAKAIAALLGRPVLQRSELRLHALGRLDDCLGPGGALGLEVRARLRERGVQLVLASVDVRTQLVLEIGQLLAGLAAAAFGLLLELGEGALARVIVDLGDDVQREVEDPLQVAGTDIKQDAQPRRACP